MVTFLLFNSSPWTLATSHLLSLSCWTAFTPSVRSFPISIRIFQRDFKQVVAVTSGSVVGKQAFLTTPR